MAYTADYLADAVAAVLDDAGVTRAVLVGHSNGTAVVRQFLRRHPERTAGLVGIEGTLRAFFGPDQVEAMAAPLRGENYREVAVGFIRGMLRPPMPEALRTELEERMLETPQHVLVSTLVEGNDPELFAEDPIEVPLLAVHARAPFWTEDYEAYVRGLAADCEYVVLEGVGHYLMLDDPERFNELVSAFVGERGLLSGER